MEEEIEVSNPIKDNYKLKPEIIRCLDVTKEYEIGEYIVKALDSITFDIYRGEFVVFQGASGAGKSTLLSIISGLDSPSKGCAEVGNAHR